MWPRLFPRQGFQLGFMFQRAAERHPGVTVTLDRPLDVTGGARLRYTYRELAGTVDDLAARLWSAGVRRGDHVVVYKTDNVDIALLACAASPPGANPAPLSPRRRGTPALHMSFVPSRFYHLLGVLLHHGSPLVLIVDPDPAAVGKLLVQARPGIVETHPNTYVLW